MNCTRVGWICLFSTDRIHTEQKHTHTINWNSVINRIPSEKKVRLRSAIFGQFWRQLATAFHKGFNSRGQSKRKKKKIGFSFRVLYFNPMWWTFSILVVYSFVSLLLHAYLIKIEIVFFFWWHHFFSFSLVPFFFSKTQRKYLNFNIFGQQKKKRSCYQLSPTQKIYPKEMQTSIYLWFFYVTVVLSGAHSTSDVGINVRRYKLTPR